MENASDHRSVIKIISDKYNAHKIGINITGAIGFLIGYSIPIGAGTKDMGARVGIGISFGAVAFLVAFGVTVLWDELNNPN